MRDLFKLESPGKLEKASKRYGMIPSFTRIISNADERSDRKRVHSTSNLGFIEPVNFPLNSQEGHHLGLGALRSSETLEFPRKLVKESSKFIMGWIYFGVFSKELFGFICSFILWGWGCSIGWDFPGGARMAMAGRFSLGVTGNRFNWNWKLTIR